jgi:hypothetical protein
MATCAAGRRSTIPASTARTKRPTSEPCCGHPLGPGSTVRILKVTFVAPPRVEGLAVLVSPVAGMPGVWNVRFPGERRTRRRVVWEALNLDARELLRTLQACSEPEVLEGMPWDRIQHALDHDAPAASPPSQPSNPQKRRGRTTRRVKSCRPTV